MNCIKGLIGTTVRMTYTNYKGITESRTVTLLKCFEGSTLYHPETQNLVEGYCHERKSNRIFAVKDISQIN